MTIAAAFTNIRIPNGSCKSWGRGPFEMTISHEYYARVSAAVMVCGVTRGRKKYCGCLANVAGLVCGRNVCSGESVYSRPLQYKISTKMTIITIIIITVVSVTVIVYRITCTRLHLYSLVGQNNTILCICIWCIYIAARTLLARAMMVKSWRNVFVTISDFPIPPKNNGILVSWIYIYI